MYLNKDICAFTLASALKETGLDCIEVLSSFALKGLSSYEPRDVIALQDRLRVEALSKAKIPILVLNTLLTRLKRRNYITAEEKTRTNKQTGAEERAMTFKLSQEGQEWLEEVDNREREIGQNINDLCDNIILYLKNKHAVILNSGEIHTMLLSFIRKNTQSLVQMINSDALIEEHFSSVSPKNEKYFIEYIIFIKNRNEPYYKTFCRLVYGSIINLVLFTENKDIDKMTTQKMKPCKVYLDTNLTFSLLGMHREIENRAAKELIDLLKQSKFKINIFNFTVYEMCSVIRGYPAYLKWNSKYPIKGIGSGLYDKLSDDGWTESDSRRFISNITNTLSEHGIEIEDISYDKWKEYALADEYALASYVEKKPKQSKLCRDHDLTAMEIIKRKRGQRVNSIEDSRVFFLTSDRILSDFNYRHMGHMDDNTISEIILDRLLANILWLKDTSLQSTVETIIAANSRYFFINTNIWDRFYEKLRECLENKRITENDVVTLFHNNFIEDFLSKYEEEDIEDVTDDLVVECIQKANEEWDRALNTQKTIIREKMELESQQKIEQFLQQLNEKDQQLSEKDNEAHTMRTQLDELNDILKKTMKLLAKRKARWVTSFTIFFINISAISILITTCLLSNVLWPILLSPLFVVLSFWLKYWSNSPWDRMNSWWSKKYYRDIVRSIGSPIPDHEENTEKEDLVE